MPVFLAVVYASAAAVNRPAQDEKSSIGEELLDQGAPYDVLIVGGGNAALCAAISARRAGARVLVLEAAPKFYRGGNTRHTRNMRCAHDAATDDPHRPLHRSGILR